MGFTPQIGDIGVFAIFCAAKTFRLAATLPTLSPALGYRGFLFVLSTCQNIAMSDEWQ